MGLQYKQHHGQLAKVKSRLSGVRMSDENSSSDYSSEESELLDSDAESENDLEG